MSEQKNIDRCEAAVGFIRANKGWIRMSGALKAGINRWTLYSLRDSGVLEQVSRGMYRLSDAGRKYRDLGGVFRFYGFDLGYRRMW